jgi:hypothetical protein
MVAGFCNAVIGFVIMQFFPHAVAAVIPAAGLILGNDPAIRQEIQGSTGEEGGGKAAAQVGLSLRIPAKGRREYEQRLEARMWPSVSNIWVCRRSKIPRPEIHDAVVPFG